MHVVPYIVAYAAILAFAVAVVSRFIMFSRLPMHLRWELYPVAHEGKKAGYGGSYLEEFEWWKKPRETSLMGELKVMIPEIVFLVALKEHNRKMWTRSFPFHFGLYLVIACTVLMVLSAILGAAWPAYAGGGLAKVLQTAAAALGVAGLGLGLIGAAGLLGRRLTARDLKGFTSPADIFNLVFFLVAFGVALLHFLLADNDFSRVGAFVANLVTGNLAALPAAGAGTPLLPASVVLLSVLLAYIPLTHMSHFVGKYFAYHAVRWNDEPNLPGSKTEGKIPDLLNKTVSWSAPHIRGDGRKKTWAEAATENPARPEEK
ncbi:respiratory nitrate reductase subunit gamma [bacterium]|nr:respiratory nitrate reductase subunit gamma [bacterium]